MSEQGITCPFCGYTTEGEYNILLHMETLHPDGESPFVARDDYETDPAILASELEGDEDIKYASCPVQGCGENILLTELDSHIDMHAAEDPQADDDISINQEASETPGSKPPFDATPSQTPRDFDEKKSQEKRHVDPQAFAKASWRNILKMPERGGKSAPVPHKHSSRKRLGKAELGPYAHEKEMPSWLVKLLESDGEVRTTNRLDSSGRIKKVQVPTNYTSGLIPVIAQLLEQDRTTQYAYLCHPAVQHVSKLRREGGFCGYRNIQMLTSHIIGVGAQGHEYFNGKIPTILDIQKAIEHAWDLGINTQGRIETGGILGTRKYIGTPDAQAMFSSLSISCDAQALRTKKGGPLADQLLYQAVESYFLLGSTDTQSKVRRTELPPIYFQHPGHSMTIIGFEKTRDGSQNLLVFDPMFSDASNVTKLVGQEFTHKSPYNLLKAYRRGLDYLGKYQEFELLKLTPPPSQRGNTSLGG
ncbi:peptidase family C78-domain-containing protein [Xylogone sp. PMI_703]|nr:peptidase family C78-domain-containing protein [Xylogone sp. PMI_703]